MTDFLIGAAGFVLFTVAVGLLRVLSGPGNSDRLMAAQLLGSGGIAALLLIATLAERLFRFTLPAKLRESGPWLVLISLVLIAWELVTAKFLILPRPFFASPTTVK